MFLFDKQTVFKFWNDSHVSLNTDVTLRKQMLFSSTTSDH